MGCGYLGKARARAGYGAEPEGLREVLRIRDCAVGGAADQLRPRGRAVAGRHGLVRHPGQRPADRTRVCLDTLTAAGHRDKRPLGEHRQSRQSRRHIDAHRGLYHALRVPDAHLCAFRVVGALPHLDWERRRLGV